MNNDTKIYTEYQYTLLRKEAERYMKRAIAAEEQVRMLREALEETTSALDRYGTGSGEALGDIIRIVDRNNALAATEPGSQEVKP